jgi:hypothetical protein
MDFKNAHYLVRREVLYNNLTEICIPVKLVRLIKTCLNKSCNEVHGGENLFDAFPIQNSMKQGKCFIAIAFQFTAEYGIRKIQENQE